MGQGARFSVDSSAFVGDSASLVYVDQPSYLGNDDSLFVTRSTFLGRNHGGTGVQVAGFIGGVAVSGSRFDSTSVGVGLYGAAPATVYANVFAGVGEEGLQAEYTADVVFDSNTVSCADPGASDAVHLYAVGGWVTRNTITGCLRGLWSSNNGSTQSLVAIGNSVTRDSTYSSNSLDITDSYDSLVVSGNIIQGGQGVGLTIVGNYSGIQFARVDSNTVRGVLGSGIVLNGSIANPVEMRYNVIADNDTNGLTAFVPVVGTYNTVVRNTGVGVLINDVNGGTFRRGNYVGNTGTGMVNGYGIGPAIVADSSWWGDVAGPRCDSCATHVSTADSVGTGVNYLLFVGAVVDSAPPIPGPLGAPVFRAVRRHVNVPAHLVARPVVRPPSLAAARAAARPRPAAPVQPGRVRP
jgi:hypothetical protein